MKKAIWISYDFGIRGDYEGIYAWLDERGASECGDSLAFLRYECSGDFIESLKKDIKNSIEVTKKTRIYVIWRDEDTKKMKGRFIFGKRKSSPWTGYAEEKAAFEDEED